MKSIRFKRACCMACALGAVAWGLAITPLHAEPETQPAATQPAEDTAAPAVDYDALTKSLNVFDNWTNGAGAWHWTDHGRIRGQGESTLVFNEPIPGDFHLQFKMTVLYGMRPRIFLQNSGAYLANEGFTQNLYLYEVGNLRGLQQSYDHGEVILVGLTVRGETIELRLNDELMARGKRRSVPATESLRLSAGDGWSQGIAEFWDFTLSADRP